MMRITTNRALAALLLAGTAALAGCGPSGPPPVAPPPPRPMVVIPPRPTPPNRAPANLPVPQVGPDGVRQTVNAHLTPAQTTWNFRSAYNVAALNCNKPQYTAIVPGYRAFLRKHARALTAANRGVDADFKAKYGARFIPPREEYMTHVYNYFSYPPTLDAFCDAALAVNADAQAVAPKDINAFAATALPRMELVFENFFRAYDQYRADAAAWDARYAPQTVNASATRPVTTPPATGSR